MNGELKPDTMNPKLEKALAGQYTFNIKQIFSDCTQAYKQNLGLWLRATGLLMLIGLASISILINLLELDFTSVESMQSSNAGMLDILMLIIMAPLLAGYRMLGLKVSASEQGEVSEIGRYFSQTLVLVTANLLISLLFQIGLNLFILPGLYIYVVTQFVVVLIADRRLGLIQAMMLSIRLVNQYLLPFSLVLLVFLLLMILVFFTMGLAILWVGPLYSLVMGRLYNDLVGYSSIPQAPISKKDSVFDA